MYMYGGDWSSYMHWDLLVDKGVHHLWRELWVFPRTWLLELIHIQSPLSRFTQIQQLHSKVNTTLTSPWLPLPLVHCTLAAWTVHVKLLTYSTKSGKRLDSFFFPPLEARVPGYGWPHKLCSKQKQIHSSISWVHYSPDTYPCTAWDQIQMLTAPWCWSWGSYQRAGETPSWWPVSWQHPSKPDQTALPEDHTPVNNSKHPSQSSGALCGN